MPDIWKQIAAGRSNLVQIVVQYIPFKPWDKDKRFFFTGRPYAMLDRDARRTFVCRRTRPKTDALPELIEATCLDVEEAEIAVKHQWQWLERGDYDQRSWKDRLEKIRKMAYEGRNLVVRGIPDANGDFVSDEVNEHSSYTDPY